MLEELRMILSEFIPKFSENHAKILCALLDSEAKSAEELSIGTRIRRDLVYEHLNLLIKDGLVKKTSSRPSFFFVENLPKALGRYVLSKNAQLKKKILELKKLIKCRGSEAQEYLFRVGEKQVELINRKTRQPIKDLSELSEVKRQLEGILRQCQENKECLLI